MTLSTDKKPIWTSKTVWGAVAAFGAGLSTAIYSYYTGDTVTALSSLVAAFGGALAFVGRINATSQLGQTVAEIATVADDVITTYAASRGIPIPQIQPQTPPDPKSNS